MVLGEKNVGGQGKSLEGVGVYLMDTYMLYTHAFLNISNNNKMNRILNQAEDG